MSCRIALHTSFGPVTLDILFLGITPSTDDVHIFGYPLLEILKVDICAGQRGWEM